MDDFLTWKREQNERERIRLTDELAKLDVRSDLIPGLVRYFCDHIETGGFLRAVLENDLYESAQRADDIDQLAAVILALFNIDPGVPVGSWGSKEKVAAWLNQKAPAPSETPAARIYEEPQ